MRAALCKSLDGPGSVVVESRPEPLPGPGEALIRVAFAALNFFDTLITRGKYQVKPELPFAISGEVAGTIAAIGAGAEGLAVGQRVAAYVGFGGAQDVVAVAASRIVAIPEGVDGAVAAGVSVTYGTAMHGLKDRARLLTGETLAVLGAAGGAGLAAVEVGKLLGARVIAVASSPDKLAACREHGADETIDYEACDLKAALRDVTGGRGVDVVYDCVGGPHAEPAVRALAWGGRYLVVGFAAGDIPRIPLNLLLLKGTDLVGVSWGNAVARDPERHRDHMREVLGWVSDGRLTPRIQRTFPLEQVTEALAVIERREAVGKVVLAL